MAEVTLSELPLGLSTGAFWRAPLGDCLAPIRAAGFRQIEVASAPSHLDYHDAAACVAAAAQIRELGLEVHSFHAPFAERIDISALDPGERDGAVREISRAAEAAAILGARYFVLHPGPETTGVPREERLDRMDCALEALDRIAWRAGELGVGLVLENMLPHLFAGHVRDLLWLLGGLASNNVGICLDTGHAFLSGDLRHVAHKLAGHLWMVHASDNRGGHDDHLPPGEGAIV
ncbi:MAG: sugar phosphate isomerase/epimerase family protein, partial [Thermoanaerobaculia bacterium]